MWRSTTGVPRRCSARGADALIAARRIGGDTAAPLKAEARRRIGVGQFFGHIAYASLAARLSSRMASGENREQAVQHRAQSQDERTATTRRTLGSGLLRRPCMGPYFFPDQRRRPEGLTRFFTGELRQFMPHQQV